VGDGVRAIATAVRLTRLRLQHIVRSLAATTGSVLSSAAATTIAVAAALGTSALAL
jgi:hypothetical protein